MTIVTSHYRYKRPPRKRKAVALEVPAIVRAKPTSSRDATRFQAEEPPANDDRQSAIVTAKNPRRGRFGDVPDMTPEEHKRRGDAADALFREMKRQIAEKLREGE
jgi:hypothetical protein